MSSITSMGKSRSLQSVLSRLKQSHVGDSFNHKRLATIGQDVDPRNMVTLVQGIKQGIKQELDQNFTDYFGGAELKEQLTEGISEGMKDGVEEFADELASAIDSNSRKLLRVVEKSVARPDYSNMGMMTMAASAVMEKFTARGMLGMVGLGNKEGGMVDKMLSKREEKQKYIKQATSLNPSLTKAGAASQFDQQQKLQKQMRKNEKQIAEYTNAGWSEEQLANTPMMKRRTELAAQMKKVDPRFSSEEYGQSPDELNAQKAKVDKLRDALAQPDMTEAQLEQRELDERNVGIQEAQLEQLKAINDKLTGGNGKAQETAAQPQPTSSGFGLGDMAAAALPYAGKLARGAGKLLSGAGRVALAMAPAVASTAAVAGAGYLGYKAGEQLNEHALNPLAGAITGDKEDTVGTALHKGVGKIKNFFGFKSDDDKVAEMLKGTPAPRTGDALNQGSKAMLGAKSAPAAAAVVAPTTNNVTNNKTVMPATRFDVRNNDSSVNRYLSKRFN